MGASSVGRNDPCPCGSGKKHKKCCLPKEEALPGYYPLEGHAMVQDPLDRLSNRANEAIQRGHFKEAERLCQELLKEYPDVVDGHERFAQLCEAQGRYQEAANHYAQVLGMIHKQPDGFDREAIEFYEAAQCRVLSMVK